MCVGVGGVGVGEWVWQSAGWLEASCFNQYGNNQYISISMGTLTQSVDHMLTVTSHHMIGACASAMKHGCGVWRWLIPFEPARDSQRVTLTTSYIMNTSYHMC